MRGRAAPGAGRRTLVLAAGTFALLPPRRSLSIALKLSDEDRRIQIAYDVVAGDYEAQLAGHLDDNPWERGALEAFARLVVDAGGGPVLDAGCGPGRLTGPLRDLGLDVAGIDLSPAMVERARRAHPDLRFDVGMLQALDVADGSLAGIVAWYSIIHTDPAAHPTIWSEFVRALRPGGHLMVGFQVGDRCDRLEHAYGHDIDLDAHRLSVDVVLSQWAEVGLDVIARTERPPVDPERHDQAYLLGARARVGAPS